VTKARVGAWCGIAAALWILVVTVVGGAHRGDDYNHASQFISELGEHGSPDGAVVSWFGFAPVGLLALAAGVLVAPFFRFARRGPLAIALIGASTALGYVGSAVARCDKGCPDAGGSTAQSVHLVVSALDLVGVMVGLVLVVLALRGRAEWAQLFHTSLAAALIVGLGSVVVLMPWFEDVAGLIQRIFEASIWVWFLGLAYEVLRRDATSPAPTG
jgi:hypothetical protein